MTSGGLCDGDVCSSPVLGGVPAKATGQYTLVFGWELALYESSMVGSGLKGGGNVNLNDVVVETFFYF